MSCQPNNEQDDQIFCVGGGKMRSKCIGFRRKTSENMAAIRSTLAQLKHGFDFFA